MGLGKECASSARSTERNLVYPTVFVYDNNYKFVHYYS